MTTGTLLIDLPIPDRLNWLLGGIRRLLGLSKAWAKVEPALGLVIWNRLHFIIRRFNQLYEQYHAGTLKPSRPRPSRKGELRRKPRAANQWAVLPRRAGWLTHMVPECAWGGGSLTTLLYQPDILAFITAVPRARSILRPLCQMFGDKMIPPILKLARRPRPPAPKRERKPRKPRPVNVDRLGRLAFARLLHTPRNQHTPPTDVAYARGYRPPKPDPE